MGFRLLLALNVTISGRDLWLFEGLDIDINYLGGDHMGIKLE